jgi:hypothetical protein
MNCGNHTSRLIAAYSTVYIHLKIIFTADLPAGLRHQRGANYRLTVDLCHISRRLDGVGRALYEVLVLYYNRSLPIPVTYLWILV